MNKNFKSAQSTIWFRLIAISLIILVLAAASCDLIFPKSGQNLNEFIKSYWSIDVTDPMQISLLIMGMKKVGNTEAFNGLTAYSHCRSELYQERGDKLLSAGNTDGARAAYSQAFLWAQDDTLHRASDKAGIYYQYANTYKYDADFQTTAGGQAANYRAAGQNVLKAAKLEPDPTIKAFYYRDAARHLAAGGDTKTGKTAYEEAVKLEPRNPNLADLDKIFNK
jgi:tetratricopeptide (TPR) repeat protein